MPETVFTPFTSYQSLFSVLSLSSRSWVSSFHPHDHHPHGRWTSAARKLALPASQAAALSQLQDWGALSAEEAKSWMPRTFAKRGAGGTPFFTVSKAEDRL